ncbi:prepilin-type N-terminal cleavage/methylation domain-containing protein [Candidatus Saccharibacteria bacterium]|nr:prepilin-type N-terminal cleavage/methylation domain-containing protein [Candidatus Saccharibacteria bacterium]
MNIKIPSIGGRRDGFTIVELLIVIIIIGILAVIAVNSFSTSQKAARNRQSTSMAQAYYRAMVSYATVNGSYPPSGVNYFCLGSGTNDVNGDGRYDCKWTGGTAHISTDTTFNNAIRAYVDITAPNVPLVVRNTSNEDQMGVQYWAPTGGTLDGQYHPWYMNYFIEPPGNCSFGKVVTDVNWPQFSATTPAGGYTYEENGIRYCMIALPNPTRL